MTSPNTRITTLGELRKSGYSTRSVKDEIRENLILKIQSGENIFPGIYGYEDTVIPEMQKALLSRHNILLLGLRGQAKTRLARQITGLLDTYIPVLKGSPVQDDPFHPISHFGKELVERMGDNAPIEWIDSSERLVEKLATPDVSVSDLIGDSDPILAATLKLPYSDERVIHFGLIPRANRGIFIINELPDLQPRIQVALFNILQEGDIQIRGFRLRLPLDILFIFTANPEDYTHRGSIITPLKDRIDSQILTHYPKSLEHSKTITRQEAHLAPAAQEKIVVPEILLDILEQVAIEARTSELVDQKSGVSARMTISAFENLVSAAELRMLKNREESTQARIADLWSIIPALTGKMELVYEGELEGPVLVAKNLINKAIRTQFLKHFPDPSPKKGKAKKESPYLTLIEWFNKGNELNLKQNTSEQEWTKLLTGLPGVAEILGPDKTQNIWVEFMLHGLAECSSIGKSEYGPEGILFRDMLSGMFGGFQDEDSEA